MDDSQDITELCLFDDATEWGDHKNTSGEETKPQPQPVEKNVEPSPLSKVPPPNVTISTTNMSAGLQKGPSPPTPSNPINGQTPPKSLPVSQTPNVQITQPSVQLTQQTPLQMSQPPSVQLVQPSKQMGLPAMQMSQPNMQMSQPNMQMSQPNMQMAQSNKPMGQPNKQMVQPNKQMVQPNMHQFNQANVQISAAAARSSPKTQISQNPPLVSQV